MPFYRPWIPLSALTEPANGKVQCLLASWPWTALAGLLDTSFTSEGLGG